MYPLATAKSWPSNQWYVAGFAHEVGSEILARRLLGRQVILFRDDEGAAHALSGVCPHRMMPLSAGKRVGDRIVCTYHGLAFDKTGACVDAPPSPTLPACGLTRFPLIEAAPILWIWMGDPALADQTPLPPQQVAGIGVPGWRTDFGKYFPLKARFPLLLDNLFDLSHLSFIHASIVGDLPVALLKPRIDEREGRLVVTRDQADVPADGYHRYLDPRMGERMTVRLESEMLGLGFIRAADQYWCGSDRNAPVGGCTNFMHAFTPETETSTHYWSFVVRNFRTDDDAFSGALCGQNNAVVAQDIVALEALEATLSDADLPQEISMESDLGALRARVLLTRMIRAEETNRPSSAKTPDGHFKFPHLWPLKLPQAGRVGLWVFQLPLLSALHEASGLDEMASVVA